MPIQRVAVIGLGKLGAPMALAFASRGFTVVGVDRDSRAVKAMRAGEPIPGEPGIDKLREARTRFKATTNVTEAVRASDATFIIVSTPSKPDQALLLDHVLSAVESVGSALAVERGRRAPRL